MNPSSPAPDSPGTPSGAPPRAGARFGPWELREPIGSGGMGEVWAAVRSDGLHQGRAAVKLLRAAPAAAPLAALLNARFAREGELLARLTHPHIAQLLDAGFAQDGVRYLVLEHVQGERIDRWCDARRLDVIARVRLLIQLCEAVAFAHANLVVHRDLKPANVLVTDSGHVKLLDFGVAKLLEDTPDNAELTRQGVAGLTPEYAAPEQITGGAVTVATDVYALGVVLFVLLSGQRPYGAAETHAAQLARAIVELEPRRLGGDAAGRTATCDPAAIAQARSSTPARLRQQLRGDLQHIAAMALRKRPTQRYTSAQALADDLQRWLNHESVSAQAPTWRYLSGKFMQRHRFGVAAAALLALAVVGGVGATAWQARAAREQAALARAEAANATAIKDFLLGVFNTSSVGDGKTTQDTTARELLQQGGERLLGETRLAPAVRLELLTVVGSLQNNLGLIDAADPLQREALEVSRKLYGPQSGKYVYALVERGLSLVQLGQPKESDALMREAVAVIERSGQQTGESYPVALYQLGFNALQIGDMKAAIDQLTRSTAAFDAHQPRHAMRAIAHRWLGNAHAATDEFVVAEASLRRSMALSAQQDKLRDYGIGLGHFGLGDLFARAGRFEEAEIELQRALSITDATLGPRHRIGGLVRNVLGRVQHQLGQSRAAEDTFATALEIARLDTSRQLGNAPDRLNLLQGLVALDDGRFDDALQRLHTASERWQGSNGATWAVASIGLAEAELGSGDARAAVERLRAAVPTIEARLGRSSLASRQAQAALGEALQGLGRETGAAGDARSDGARLAFTAALATAPSDLASASPTQDWIRARGRLGLARLSLSGDPARSLREARAAQAGMRPNVLRERTLLAQARQVEAAALAAGAASVGAGAGVGVKGP